MKNKIKYIITFIMGGIVFSTVCVIGANIITAKQVGINSSKTTKTNIQDAIDELYTLTTSYKKSNIEMAKIGDTYKAIVYLDPTNLSRSCNKSNSVSTSETKTGCMKWYAFSETVDTYTMILDHNTTAKIAWNTNNKNTAMGTTSGNIGYALNQLVSTNKWKVTPRLISREELAFIIGNISFINNHDNLSFQNKKYFWLQDNLNACYYCLTTDGGKSSEGYWTSSVSKNNDYDVNYMHDTGQIWWGAANLTNFGLRPVITVSKTSLGL